MALTPEQFERLKRLALQKSLKSREGIDTGQGFLKETIGDIGETVVGVAREFGKAGEDIVSEIGSVSETKTVSEALRRPVSIGAAAFRGSSRAFGEAIIGVGKILTPQSLEDKVSGIVGEIGKSIAKKPFTQELIQKYAALPEDTRKDINNALGFSEGLAEILTLGAASKISRPIIKSAIKAVEQATKRTVQTVGKVTGPVTSRIAKLSPLQKIRDFRTKLNPQTEEQFIDSAKAAINDSFVGNTTTRNKLDDLASHFSSKGDEVTREDLVDRFAREGFMPSEAGKLADSRGIFKLIADKQDRIINAMNPVLETIPELTKLSDLKIGAKNIVRDSPSIIADFEKANSQIDKLFKNLEAKFGKDTLNAVEINQIRKEMNKITRAFRDDVFKQDAANAIGSAVRSRLDDIAPKITIANKRWGELQQFHEMARVFHNQPIDIGVFGSSFGRLAITLGAGSAGFQITGPGGLVLAGILATFGGNAFAQLLRNKRFSQKLKDSLIRLAQQDDEIVEQLIKQADEANREMLERVLLKGPAETPIIVPPFLEPTGQREFIERALREIEEQTTRSEIQKVLQNQARRFTSRDAFIKSVRGNPAWLNKFEQAGTTPESIAGIVF